jgi:hypothetical protein
MATLYMGLFRTAKGHGVSLQKGARLLAELRDLVALGYCSHSRLPARPCPPKVWADAIQVMLDGRPGLKLPMPNHVYLVKVAYDLADRQDREVETAIRTAEQGHRLPSGERRQPTEPVSIADCNPLHSLMFVPQED